MSWRVAGKWSAHGLKHTIDETTYFLSYDFCYLRTVTGHITHMFSPVKQYFHWKLSFTGSYASKQWTLYVPLFDNACTNVLKHFLKYYIHLLFMYPQWHKDCLVGPWPGWSVLRQLCLSYPYPSNLQVELLQCMIHGAAIEDGSETVLQHTVAGVLNWTGCQGPISPVWRHLHWIWVHFWWFSFKDLHGLGPRVGPLFSVWAIVLRSSTEALLGVCSLSQVDQVTS